MEARRLGPSADDSAAWLFAVERDANGGELRLVDAGAPSSISGIEQEYAVWLDDVQVPFAPLLGAVLPNAPTRGFGEDPLARVRRDGAVWTADGPHAETATPPRRLAPGIATRLADDTLHQREMLLRRLRRIAETDGTRLELRGYSTHVNAFCASVDAWAVVRRFGELYGPAIMLLADRRDSPGLLIRPRPERLEIGTEYLESRDDLVAVALVTLAAAVDCWRAVAGPAQFDQADLRPLDASGFQSTWQRPGIFIGRDAFGGDVYEHGRGAELRLADGQLEPAGDRLRMAWNRLRPIADGFATEPELAAVDARVAGTVRLPSERPAPLEPPVRRGHRVAPMPPGDNAELLGRLIHGALQIEPAVLDWDASLLRISRPGGVVFARVPRDDSSRFAALVGRGELAPAIEARAAAGGSPAVTSPEDRTPGIFDILAPNQEEAARLRQATAPQNWQAAPAVSGLSSVSLASRKMTVGPVAATPLASTPQPFPWLRVGLSVLIIVLVVGGMVAGGLVTGAGTSGSPSPGAGSTCLDSVAGAGNAACAGAGSSAQLRASATPSQSAGTSPVQCLAGEVCPSASPGASASPCLVGAPCASGGAPAAAPTPRPTRRPTPKPKPTATPSPTFCDPTKQAC